MSELLVRRLGQVEYRHSWDAMQRYTRERDPGSADQLWLLEHPRVFTLGRAGRPEHLLDPGDIPVVMADRGGQVTYHGPGQLVVYTLVDLQRLGLGVRDYVHRLEQSVIDLLDNTGIAARRRTGAPGVYVGSAKLAALGLRVQRGCCYHGLALNVNLDLSPYQRINPCGYAGQPVTRLADLGLDWSVDETADRLLAPLCRALGLPRADA